MSLSYLIDENLRGTLSIVLVRESTRRGLSLDLLEIGDLEAPPLGSLDPDILIWAEMSDRILISRDRRTLGRHLADHLAAGRKSPGILLLRDEPLMVIAEVLVLIAFASDPTEWQNRISYVP